MGFFDNFLKENESLFRDEIALDLDFMPPKILYRENENQYIAECIKPLIQKRSGKNLFITGNPGIGKTVATKNVLNELEQKGLDEHITPLYINCWKKDSAHKIILEICDQLNYKFTLNKTTEQLMREISNILNKKAAVIVLDEVDKLSNDATMVLYSITEDIFRKTIILITNNKDFLSLLDHRIYSRLMPEILEFKPYTKEETYGILKQRIGYAFAKNVFSEKALIAVAGKAFQSGDIRIGLYLLRESGNIAERKLKRKINEEHVNEAIKKLPEFKIISSDVLTNDEHFLLQIIKENSGKTTKEIHQIYDTSISYRTFLRKIKNLEEANLIHTQEQNIGEGKKTLVYFGSIKKLDEF